MPSPNLAGLDDLVEDLTLPIVVRKVVDAQRVPRGPHPPMLGRCRIPVAQPDERLGEYRAEGGRDAAPSPCPDDQSSGS